MFDEFVKKKKTLLISYTLRLHYLPLAVRARRRPNMFFILLYYYVFLVFQVNILPPYSEDTVLARKYQSACWDPCQPCWGWVPVTRRGPPCWRPHSPSIWSSGSSTRWLSKRHRQDPPSPPDQDHDQDQELVYGNCSSTDHPDYWHWTQQKPVRPPTLVILKPLPPHLEHLARRQISRKTYF